MFDYPAFICYLLTAVRRNITQTGHSLWSIRLEERLDSFFQNCHVIMSEGDQWAVNQVADASLTLRSGTAGKPVSVAQKAVRRFATKGFGKTKSIAALKD